ncbi:MAG: tRNA pseudouridine(13) synthase TruD [Candidatus Marsarchaeota archaeon]|nr:tRNA pseudouridine(13) synthase TruD [Candidatus Marsarchaeota archaeon]
MNPEDFIVEEIDYTGRVLKLNEKINEKNSEGDQTLFILQKKNWNTLQALSAIAKAVGRSRKSFSSAGNKDRNAITVQLCSAYKVKPEELLYLKIKDIQINGAWTSNEKIAMGKLKGNNFIITFNKKIIKKERVIPNEFGPQRFGSMRKNTAKIGKLLVQGRFKEAVTSYLCDGNDSSKKERTRLKKDKNFKKALEYFPKFLRYERIMIEHLSQHQNDYVGALRRIPRTLQLLFIHAYQAKLFNEEMKKRNIYKAMKNEFYCGANELGFPSLVKKRGDEKKAREGKVFVVANIIGSETKLNKTEEKILKKEKIKKEDFNLKSMPELSSKGGLRALTMLVKISKTANNIQFKLPPGSYATTVLKRLK